ncbi:MAG TPA: hypothetical protein HPP76_01055 [Desulfuromonadales bacterium]|nr:hypothetical protein [Desulfuromonadales bacterium]
MFGKKNALLLQAAEETIKRQQEKIDWYQRHYEKQQQYIDDLYDLIADLARQLGAVLNAENIERLKNSPYLENNSNFMLDLYTLFSTRFKKGKNVTCYFGKDLSDIKKKFSDRDFKNCELAYLTERFSLGDLRRVLKEGMWKNHLDVVLRTIRRDKKLDQ